MKATIKRLKNWLKSFRKPKPYLLFDKYEIVPAFSLDGEVYYMHRDPLNTACGRGLTAMMFMEELMMRCDVEYLKNYVLAVRAIFSDPKKIDVLKLATLTNQLDERVHFLAAVPEHVYKLATVVFFTKDESPIKYDQVLGQQHVEQWMNTPGMYDFFLQTPLVQLVPSLALPETSSKSFLEVQQIINDFHLREVRQRTFENH